MDTKSKVVKVAVVIAGMVLQFATLSGCAPTGARVSEAGESRQPAVSAEDSESGFSGGIRVSRAFFERSLIGAVDIAGHQIQSSIGWSVSAPTAPLPDGPVLADFRERQGCAKYQNTNGVRVCFTIVPDISSLGVNKEEVKAYGFCGRNMARLLSAENRNGELHLVFAGECESQAYVARVTLRQI